MMVYIIIFIMVIWGIFLYNLLNKHIFKYITYYNNLNSQEKDKYYFYLRDDIKKFNKFKIYIKGYFLIPFRSFGYLFIFIILYITFKFLVYIFGIKNFNEEQPKNFIYISKKISSVLTRFSNYFFLGIRVNKKIIKSKNPSTKKEIEGAKILISNHTSWLESRYFLSLDQVPAIMIDHYMKNEYLIGFFAKLNQCVFIKNHDNKSKEKIKSKLNKRANNYKIGKNISPLLIFPEGMVCNSKSILPFKKGAFYMGLPIRMFCVEYANNYINPKITLFDFQGSFLLSLTNFRNNITVYEFDRLVYPNEFLNSNNTINYDKMSEYCRDKIANVLKLKKIDLNNIYEVNKEYRKFKSERLKKIN